MPRLHSLKGRLLLAITVLVIGSGLVISSLAAYRYSRVLYSAATTHAENLSHQIALQAADKILINDLVSLQKLIDQHMRSHSSLSYLFVLRDGDVLAHSFADGFPANLIGANRSDPGGEGSIIRIQNETGEDFLDFAHPILEGKAGVLRMGLSEQPLRRQVNGLWLQMMLITAAILCAGITIGHLFLKRITGPLSSLAKAAEDISGGRLDIQVAVSGRDEVGRLSASFNQMVARIQGDTHRLEEKTAELDRAYRQTRDSFAIVQEVGSKLTLHDVCIYLIRRFQGVVACRRMAMLVFLENKKNVIMVSESGSACLAANFFETASAAVQRLDETAFLKPDVLRPPLVPAEFESARRLVIAPFQHEERLLGALVIACTGECACDRKGLDVINLIFRQTAGTIRRAALQEEEIRDLQERVESSAEFSGIIGKAPQMRIIYKLIEDTAPTDATVLIQGESGTGKELIAKAIHQLSPRRDKPFIVINCSAFPATLLESELFGHEKGAFTSAIRQKAGRFEQADGGTVFLDEIGEIAPSAQIKLLRVLQTQKFERLGGEKTIHVNVRFLAATNRDLLQEVRQGNFREDLYYRLNVIPINLPALNSRVNDIPLLARSFLRRYCQEQGKTIHDFSSEAMRLLLEYAWPGNVRELENSIEHAVVLAKSQLIEVADLPSGIHKAHAAAGETGAGHPKTIVQNEKRLLQEVLAECGWNKKRAAQRLGISRSTLYDKIRKHEITQPTLH
jgi:transcriptional regulator with GAF, ATPase, and Fis domain